MARSKKRFSEKEEKKALRSFDLTKAILPVLIGVAVVAFMFFRQFDYHEFQKIDWSGTTMLFLAVALLFLVGRITFYALRLRILSDHAFSFLKCVQLIFIWEFSSAVSPTNVGGSAVALFILSQEKIGAAKTTAIVIYTIVLDTLFFLLCIPLWVLVFGANVLGPGKEAFGGWQVTLLSAYAIMFLYGLFFSYGLFVRPQSLRRLSLYLSRRKLLKRFRRNLEQLGEDIVVTSKALLKRNAKYHLQAFLTTTGAWSCRFFLIISLIMGITKSVPFHLNAIMELYARIQTMFVMMALTPTPGGAGLAELLFGSILSDYVPKGISLVVASIWRLMAYYFFLFMGIIIIPQWLRMIIKQRKDKKTVVNAGMDSASDDPIRQ